MDRRQFLLASATAAALPVLGSGVEPANASAWPKGCIEVLPKSDERRMAWTVDDGSSPHSLKAYINLLEAHPDLRMTFFVLSSATGWRTYRKPLTELVATGQVQLANHTRHHINLVRASSRQIASELRDCAHHIEHYFGVDPGPYWRPPYGYIDRRVIEVAADHGFTAPVMWLGTTGAATFGPGGTQSGVWRNCKRWMHDRNIVIDHANSMVTPNNFSRILKLLERRNLPTVTIADVFG